MAALRLCRLDGDTLPAVSAFVAACQREGHGHVGYLGVDPGSIATELRELEPAGLAGTQVAWDSTRLVGVLGASWDTDPARVWWYGPFLAAGSESGSGRPAAVGTLTPALRATADALFAAGRALLPGEVVEEELAPDERNLVVAAIARRDGFHPEEASAVLRWRAGGASDGVGGAAGGVVGAAGGVGPSEAFQRRAAPPGYRHATLLPSDQAEVAALHDALFAGTHTPGHRLAEGQDRVVMVARIGAALVGYVAAERQLDGTGYLDYLGVAPPWRGQGVGHTLVDAAVEVLVAGYGCQEVHLTVRESNTAARRLYASCGFVQERLLRPWRRGFRVDVPREPAQRQDA